MSIFTKLSEQTQFTKAVISVASVLGALVVIFQSYSSTKTFIKGKVDNYITKEVKIVIDSTSKEYNIKYTNKQKLLDSRIKFLENELIRERKRGNNVVAAIFEEMDTEEYSTAFGKVSVEATNATNYWTATFEKSNADSTNIIIDDLVMLWSLEYRNKPVGFRYKGFNNKFIWVTPNAINNQLVSH